MKFPLTEPTNPRYLFINPETNQVHVLMPIVSGTEIGLDNTCKSVFALQEFFGKTRGVHQRAVLDELTAYKKALEFDIRLLDDNVIKTKKEERLSQINQYIMAVDAVLKSAVLNPLNLAFAEYPLVLQEMMKKETANLYSMVLRPKRIDNFLRFVNPVFSVKRNDPSVFYDTLSEAYQGVTKNLDNAKNRIIAKVLASPAGENNDFAGMQLELTEVTKNQLGVVVDFNQTSGNQPLTKAYIDGILAYNEDSASAEEYINMLLSVSAPELFNTLNESPFYTRNDAEELSIITQFFLASMNIYCRANAISSVNFGEVLDNSEELSEGVAAIVLSIYNGDNIEDALLHFLNEKSQDFGLKRTLAPADCAQIKKKFTQHYSEIRKAPHFDEFIILDNSNKGPFVSHKGSICLDFSLFIRAGFPELAPDYFENILDDFNTLEEAITLGNPSVHATIELSVEELIAKIKDEDQLQAVLDKLPQEQKDEILASPQIKGIQVPKFLLHVARGEQVEAENLLKANPGAQFLLQAEPFIDYSGRTFNCTAFEYAYWAKDTHMCRMLIKHMDNETKREMLKKCDAIEKNGLTYLQQGEVKQSRHFDFTPLINALKNYVEQFDKRTKNENDEAWRTVGISQCDLPAHVVHEYCRPDRSFNEFNEPSFHEFNEPSLPRVLAFYNLETKRLERWFPLPIGENSGLGFDFAIYMGYYEAMGIRRGDEHSLWVMGLRDLTAVSHLNEVRSADLKQLRNDLNVAKAEESPGMCALQ
ncbi:MAG: hypothetical protein Q8M03_04975 [Legionella sp.]|nr:hypothetical protein [Legionella sp.]